MSKPVDERVIRLQRRMTGPWTSKQIGPLVTRYRRRPDIEFLAFSVACADIGHALRGSQVNRWMRRAVRWMAGWIR